MGVWLSLPQPRSSTQLAGHHTGDSNGAKAKLHRDSRSLTEHICRELGCLRFIHGAWVSIHGIREI